MADNPAQVVAWDEKNQRLFINGLPVSLSVLEAIADPDKRLLWRFVNDGTNIMAIPYSEQHVIWLEKEIEG